MTTELRTRTEGIIASDRTEQLLVDEYGGWTDLLSQNIDGLIESGEIKVGIKKQSIDSMIATTLVDAGVPVMLVERLKMLYHYVQPEDDKNPIDVGLRPLMERHLGRVTKQVSFELAGKAVRRSSIKK